MRQFLSLRIFAEFIDYTAPTSHYSRVEKPTTTLATQERLPRIYIYIYHVIAITTYTHVRRKSLGKGNKAKKRKYKKGKERNENKKKSKTDWKDMKRQEKQEKTRQEEQRKEKRKNVILEDPRN